MRVLLKAVENADIGTVQFAHETKPPVFCVYAEFYLQIGSATKQREIFFFAGPMMFVGQDFFPPE
jgi:hypothetical protein